MNVKTLLNKLILKEYQTIRILDRTNDFFLESRNKKEIVSQCGKNKVSTFEYSMFGNCFIVSLHNLKK
ncbi:MAG: hypothetical protein NSGCLCUN01_03918 [uncultured Clostridium sp.]